MPQGELSVWRMLEVERESRILGTVAVAAGIGAGFAWYTGHLSNEYGAVLTFGPLGGGVLVLVLGWLFSTRELDRPMYVSR